MVKGRPTKDASSDENFNEMRKQRGKERQNNISKLWSCPRAMKKSIEVISPKTRSWKPRQTRTIDGKPTTRKTTSKTTKIWPNPRRCSSNINRNLRKKKSNQYWSEKPTTLWETTTQLGTHKFDLQQILYNLTDEEGEEE